MTGGLQRPEKSARSGDFGVIPRTPVRVGLWLVVLAVVGAVGSGAEKSADARNTDNARAGYAGSEACAGCHQDIYRKYLQTAMGRSIVEASPGWLKTQITTASLEDKNSH